MSTPSYRPEHRLLVGHTQGRQFIAGCIDIGRVSGQFVFILTSTRWVLIATGRSARCRWYTWGEGGYLVAARVRQGAVFFWEGRGRVVVGGGREKGVQRGLCGEVM